MGLGFDAIGRRRMCRMDVGASYFLLLWRLRVMNLLDVPHVALARGL